MHFTPRWDRPVRQFTDIVSPKDLREFLLPDFDEIRMGVTAHKLIYYFGMSTIEAVWTP
ncbi:MAG: hypothetical protein ACFCUM_18390 [Bacteroidales bacterium]